MENWLNEFATQKKAKNKKKLKNWRKYETEIRFDIDEWNEDMFNISSTYKSQVHKIIVYSILIYLVEFHQREKKP